MSQRTGGLTPLSEAPLPDGLPRGRPRRSRLGDTIFKRVCQSAALLVVVLAVPQMLGVLMAGAAAGCLLAWRLIAWHRRHPNSGLPENRIVLR